MTTTFIRMSLLLCLSQNSLLAAGSAQAAFDLFKSLKGTWTIQSGDKTLPFKMTYDTRSKNSIVTEYFGSELSVFYRDGETLLMTHFCNAGNQPRLRLKENSPPGYFEFEMFDITGLKDLQGGAHVQRAIYRAVNDRQMGLELVWKKGNSLESEKYVLRRDGLLPSEH